MRVKNYLAARYERSTKERPQKDGIKETSKTLKQDAKESAERGPGLPEV